MKQKINIQENLEKIKKLAGGFHLGKGLTPSQMNKLLDERYEEMLADTDPRRIFAAKILKKA